MSENPNVIARNADGTPLQRAKVSASNSTSSVPTVAAPYTGTAEDILDFVGITITLGTAQNALHTGTGYFEFSPDNVHWDVSVPIYYSSDAPFVPYPLRKISKWFRVRYVPNDDNLTEFRLTTLLHRLAPETLTRLFNQDIAMSEPVKVIRAGVMVENLAGDAMENLRGSHGEGLLVNPMPAGAASEATLAQLLAQLQSVLSQLDVALSSRASETTLAALLVELGQKLEAGGSVNVGNFPATQPVSVVALPLPTNAATETTLALLLAELAQKLEPGGSVNVSNFPATQPVSAAVLPLPTNAATETTVAAILSELAQKTEPANNQNVLVTNWPPELGGSIEAQLYDLTDPTTFYIGSAVQGTLPAAAAWRIKRITFVGGNPTETRWTDATAVWNDRLTETYT